MGEWSEIAKWLFGIVAFLICAAVIAVWKLVSNKANAVDVEKQFNDHRLENKAQADESLRQYRELRTMIEGLQKELTALDKHSLTSGDLIEMKADIKEVIKGQRDAVKLIDGMPERLTSLEATRNKQSEK